MPAPNATDLGQAVGQALREADAERRLSTLGGGDLVVVVPDLTRELDYERALRPLIHRLSSGGCTGRLFVGLGLHRPMVAAEIEPLQRVGRDYGWAVEQHDPRGNLIELDQEIRLLPGHPGSSLRASFAKTVGQPALRILVGTVEPHQYAGFSGGFKALAIGCAGAETIAAMHGLELLREPGTRLGVIDGNPFAAAVRRLGSALGPSWALQIVPAGDGQCLFAGFGDVDEVFDRAVGICRRSAFVETDQRWPWVHVPVTGEKAKSFYQASRYASYLALTEQPVVEDGGLIVLEASCSEGAGRGEGERAFVSAMERGLSALRRELATGKGPSAGGAQRAHVLARALGHCRIALVSDHEVAGIDAIGIQRFDRLEDALNAHGCSPGEGKSFSDVLHRVPVFRAQSSQS